MIRGRVKPLAVLPVRKAQKKFCWFFEKPAEQEATLRLELRIKVLQTLALPLGYVANIFNLPKRQTRLELAALSLGS